MWQLTDAGEAQALNVVLIQCPEQVVLVPIVTECLPDL